MENLMEKKNLNRKKALNLTSIGLFAAAIIIAIIIAFFTMCSGGEVDNSIAYDSDGFLGYSDSFWDWWGDQ